MLGGTLASSAIDFIFRKIQSIVPIFKHIQQIINVEVLHISYIKQNWYFNSFLRSVFLKLK